MLPQMGWSPCSCQLGLGTTGVLTWGLLGAPGGWERWWHHLRSGQRRKAPGQEKEILARVNVSGTCTWVLWFSAG